MLGNQTNHDGSGRNTCSPVQTDQALGLPAMVWQALKANKIMIPNWFQPPNWDKQPDSSPLGARPAVLFFFIGMTGFELNDKEKHNLAKATVTGVLL